MAEPLPHKPEPLEALRARYPAALEVVYGLDDALDGTTLLPGRNRANVFDHEDGLRLIIIRTRLSAGHLIISVSASFPVGSRLYEDFRVLAMTGRHAADIYAAWARSIPRRFREISGDPRELRLLGVGGNYIPHFAIEEGSACPA